ncbi:ATP-grasp domain-containing protein [Legionella sp. km535]|uniref:ATP-grasp domain-containing protein n=1 Tax=Legionella sp. km535 TaxID=2498107 RepID=UPI000F8F035F|nr:ATP-grasp domain-containing protein [Legionella sp. km535]RUR15411.1 ATP-grasp domain-containing protein [Legionella sp. km535]
MNNVFSNAVLIINPIASPFYLNEKFKKTGMFLLACFTNNEIEYLIKPSLEGELFDHVALLSGDFEIDVALINNVIQEKNLEIKLAFSSSEYDLYYSDKIAYYFCPQYANRPETSGWRCNKRLMNEQLRINGTASAKQKVITDINNPDLSGFEYPVVIKPAEGTGGSIGVSICHSFDEIKQYFNTLDKQKWAHCYVPDEFLVEELLIGDEYIIDMVAWDSKFYLIGIYYAEKELYNSHKVCRHREFLAHDDPIAIELFEYCSKVLTNLDVQYGMMHLECMHTKDGPILIELNPRVSGVSGVLNYFSEALIGYDQASLFIEKLEDQEATNKIEPVVKNYGVVFYLQNFGYKYDKVNEQLFKSVPSYLRHIVKIPCQPEKSYPKNLLDTVAFVILVNDSEETVRRDLEELKSLEEKGAFFE